MFGRDHARTLGEAVEPHGRAVDRRGRGGAFRKCVGRHDRPRRRLPGVRRQGLERTGQRRDDAVGRRRLADHAGRGNENLAFVTAQQPRHGLGRLLDDPPAGSPGEHVGVAGIDDDRPHGAARQALPAPHNRVAGCARQSEDPGDGAVGRQLGNHHVGAPGVPDAGFMRRETHAGDRIHCRKTLGGERRNGSHRFGLRGKAGRARRGDMLHIGAGVTRRARRW